MRTFGYIVKKGKLTLVLAITLFIAVVLRSAWLADDAYITFRTVDNFINGYGLTWNTAERVQTYTHPLWMFLLSGVYFFTGEIYYSTIFLSVAITLFTVALLAFGIARSTATALLGLTILIFSKAFVDYSTSGLENPLTHLILGAFVFIYLKSETMTLRKLFLLSLIAAIGTLNRMDVFLLFFPGLIYSLLKIRELKGVYAVTLGFVPFILWELFSLFYYGFLFPNTAYAKLNTGISSLVLLQYGFYYLLNSINWDPLTFSVIIMGLTLPFITRQWRNLPIAVGLALYLLYVVKIGGDFMSGRFLAAPVFMAVTLLANSSWPALQSIRLPVFVGGIILAGLIVRPPYSPLLSTAAYGLNHDLYSTSIEDGRGVYYQVSGLLNANRGVEFPDHRWIDLGRLARLDAPCITTGGGIGYLGFYAGPDVHILDFLALGDPLLARLPVTRPYWSIGHFGRLIPHGYLKTLDSGQNNITDKNLAAYYDRLSLITRGDLAAADRLRAIWAINLGQYNHFIESYTPLFQVHLLYADKFGDAKIWTPAGKLEHYNGIKINLSKKWYAKQMGIKLVHNPLQTSQENDDQVKLCRGEKRASDEQAESSQITYQFIYFDENLPVVRQYVLIPLVVPKDGAVKTIDIPLEAVKPGYDRIEIFTDGKNYLDSTIYNIEQIRLLEN